MAMPIPPSAASTLGNEEERSGALERDEASFILDATLKKKHRSEAHILAFIDSFIRCKNIAQASAEAGINKGEGYRIRHLSDVSNAITKLTERSAIKYGFDASEVVERVKEVMDFDPIMLQNPDGTFKSNLYDVDPEARRNIKKFKAKNLYADVEDLNGIKKKIIVGELIEVEFYDKMKAAELVGKEKELFKNTTKVEHTVSADMASILLESAKRGAQASLDMSKRNIIEVQGSVRDADED